MEQLKTQTGGKVRAESIARTPIPGIFEVRSGLSIFYVDSSGRYAFLEGHLLDLKSTRDLTRESQESASRITFDSLPFDLALKTVRGTGKRRIAVFEDPTCPYCRALRTLLSHLDDVTIYTFPYPVLSANSYEKARAALCAPNPSEAWAELVKAGTFPAWRQCTPSIERIIELGTRLSIQGTPTVFFANGRRAQGAMRPDEFMAMLHEAEK
jgi:thiol:disulfide interchange protein DsbC